MIPKKEPTLLSSYWKNSAVDYADWFSSRYPEIDYDTCAKVGAYIEGLVKAILTNADELNSPDSLRQEIADMRGQTVKDKQRLDFLESLLQKSPGEWPSIYKTGFSLHINPKDLEGQPCTIREAIDALFKQKSSAS